MLLVERRVPQRVFNEPFIKLHGAPMHSPLWLYIARSTTFAKSEREKNHRVRNYEISKGRDKNISGVVISRNSAFSARHASSPRASVSSTNMYRLRNALFAPG